MASMDTSQATAANLMVSVITHLFHDHRALHPLSLAVLSPCVFSTLLSQAALRSFTSNLMSSSMKLNHEKPGLLNYSLPTSLSQDSRRQTRQSRKVVSH